LYPPTDINSPSVRTKLTRAVESVHEFPDSKARASLDLPPVDENGDDIGGVAEGQEPVRI
jgi:hypothetical protein